jgi:CRP/FNR family transcriptional regulator, cyclic AMP receptor protein
MIACDQLKRMGAWSRELTEEELGRARAGISLRSFSKGAYICHRGERFDYWTGVAEGLLKLSTFSKGGRPVTLAGIRNGGWFGEGALLKGETRQYDLVALRDTQLAMMDRPTFLWLFERSVGFNKYLVRQFNERLGQFIALVEYERTLDAPARLARSIAWLFNPVLYPEVGTHLGITQEEIGLLSGLSRQWTNKSLKQLERESLLRVERSGITILDLDKLARYE